MGLPGRIVLLLALSSPLFARQGFRLNYDLQSTDIPAEQSARVIEYLRANPLSYFLVQGFACDTGGFAVSIKIAESRAKKARQLIQGAVPDERLRFAPPTVIKGEPRTEHRKLEIAAFDSPAEVDAALTQAIRKNREAHSQFGIAETGIPPPEAGSEIETGSDNGRFWLLGLAVLILIPVLYLLFTKGRKRGEPHEEHRLTEEQAEAVEAITGEPVLQKKRGRTPITAKSVVAPQAFIQEFRSTGMAPKKKTKPVPTIRKALDKAFETRSLSEIAKSPIHALQGLTPRHSKMLEEAFGVKTVEDLASLKYFELARAITVLARYEE